MTTRRMSPRESLLLAASAALALCLFGSASVRAQQWTTATNSSDIKNANSGSVGVGTSDPTFGGVAASKLSVMQADAWTGFALGNTSGVPRFALNGNSAGSWTMYDWGAGQWRAGITQMGGSVGIGTSTPTNALHVHNALGLGMIRVSGAGGGLVNFYDTAAGTNQKLYQWRSEGGVFRMALVNDDNVTFSRQNILTANSAGNVGIGTATPDAYGDGATVNYLTLQAAGANQHAQLAVAGTGTGNGQIVLGNSTVRRAIIAAVNGSHLLFYVNSADSGTSATEAMRITKEGRVGIGATNPTHTLEVNGTINASGAVTGATINATYQDVAEWVPSTQKLSAGTVVVLDAERTNHVLASTSAYDTKVAGVVSERPGISLGEAGEGKALVATTGRVRVRVDATRAAIRVGDLLVTSDAEGVAMKSAEVDLGGIKIHRPGTIIGKALEPLASGTGEILVLLSLQ